MQMNDNQGNRLKKLIRELGFNNKEFAEKLNLNANYISMLITNKREISTKFIHNITNVIPEANTSWLLSGEGKMLNTSVSENIDAEYGEKDQLNISDKEVIEYIINNKEKLLKNKSFIEMLDIPDIEMLKNTIQISSPKVLQSIRIDKKTIIDLIDFLANNEKELHDDKLFTMYITSTVLKMMHREEFKSVKKFLSTNQNELKNN